ncbi:MAG: glycoside hydrolase family 5 protein [Anaerolineales bacterium]|nr:glycoside hydrolase family 5 protein [Anaerolineales bacterium]
MRSRRIYPAIFWFLLCGCLATSTKPVPAHSQPGDVSTLTLSASRSRITTAEPSAPTGEWPDAFAMNARIGRAVNFGNALEAPNEGEWGVVLREEYFQLAADAGFDAIRLPVRWNTHALEDSPHTIHTSFFDRIDWAVENALSRGLVLILDFHHFTDYMDCAGCERTRLLLLWAQIAEHYRGYPPELVFELLNEPTDAVPAAEWNDALASTLGVIRASNPQRTVVVGPVHWNAPGLLDSLDLPEDDRNLIVTFHYYNPFPFTHQGAEWAEGSDAWLGTTWTGSAAEQKAIRDEFLSAAEWGLENNRPLFLGEFGAYQRADMASRALWTAFVAREAEAESFSWAYWEFCAGFGLYDLATNRWRDPLLRALLPNSPVLAR